MSAKDAGLTFMEQLLAHVPEDKQAAAREALMASEAALTELGAATLRQSEFSRGMDANNQYKAQLDGWFAENQADLAEAKRLKAAGITAQPTPTPTPTFDPATFQTALDKAIEQVTREGTAAIVHVNELSLKHFKTFSEPLDIQTLMRDPEITKLGLTGVYQKTYQPKYDALAKTAEDARINTEVEKRLVEERKRFASPMPYPTSSHEPSVLDALEQAFLQPVDPSKPVTAPAIVPDVVAQAAQEYMAAVASRQGSPTV